MKKRLFIGSILLLITAAGISGCSGKKPSEQAASLYVQTSDLPALDAYDPGMSKASFISAPDPETVSGHLPGFGNDPTEYTVSYDLKCESTSACFALGDGNGMYGELALIEIRNNQEGSFLTLKRSSNGKVTAWNEEGLTEDITPSDIYHVKIDVLNGTMGISINDAETLSCEAPSYGIGCLGIYKERSQSYAYIDNIELTGSDGVKLSEDFEKEENIFSPQYTKIKDGSLRVSSGFTLTGDMGDPAPVFRRTFEHKKSDISKAILYMTALGSFDVSINGKRVSEDFLDPGALMFNKELKYVAYDVTPLIEDQNTLDITLLHGWYDRAIGYPENSLPWGEKTAVKGELIIEDKKGNITIIPTDDSFKVSRNSPVRFDDIYQGEVYDASYSSSPDEGTFAEVEVNTVDASILGLPVTAKKTAPVRAVETLTPVSVSEPVSGSFVYDFGVNAVGNIFIDLNGQQLNTSSVDIMGLGAAEGETLTFRYGELTNMDNMSNTDDEIGTVWTENLLTAKATDYYKVGKTNDTIEFRYTIHGFRYMQIDGLDKAIPVENIRFNVLMSDLYSTGTFTCSEDLINKYFENSKRSVMSNFIDKPTDCPQRDERLGWAGDAQNASLFASFLFNTGDFYMQYLDHLCALQTAEGAFPDTAPRNIGGYGKNCWGDAPVVIAWNLYLQYGEKAVLERYYDSCVRWVNYLTDTSVDYIREMPSYGDHLAGQDTSSVMSDTAWCAHSADLVSRMASVLGKNEDAVKYHDIFENYRKAWLDKYIRPDGSVAAGLLTEESETAYALGIEFGLFDDEMMQDAADRLSMLCQYDQFLFKPGYSGLCYILPALSRFGHADTAYSILTCEMPGSLLYTVDCGMTSVPESLYAFTFNEDQTFNVSGSLNHYAYASVCAYMFTDILGIQPDPEHPGYEHFFLKPLSGLPMSEASGSYETKYGTIEVSVSSGATDPSHDNKIKCTVPKGTTCTLTLPDGTVKDLEAGTYEFDY